MLWQQIAFKRTQVLDLDILPCLRPPLTQESLEPPDKMECLGFPSPTVWKWQGNKARTACEVPMGHRSQRMGSLALRVTYLTIRHVSRDC